MTLASLLVFYYTCFMSYTVVKLHLSVLIKECDDDDDDDDDDDEDEL